MGQAPSNEKGSNEVGGENNKVKAARVSDLDQGQGHSHTPSSTFEDISIELKHVILEKASPEELYRASQLCKEANYLANDAGFKAGFFQRQYNTRALAHAARSHACRKGDNTGVLNKLLQNSACSIDAGNEKDHGWGIIHYSAFHDNDGLTTSVCKHGADVNMRVLSGEYATYAPLHLCIQATTGMASATIAVLMEHGADPFQECTPYGNDEDDDDDDDDEPTTALQLAAKAIHGASLKAILAYMRTSQYRYAKLNVMEHGTKLLHSTMSIDGADALIGMCGSAHEEQQLIDSRREHGITSLMSAVKNNNLNLVRFLVHKGARLYAMDNNGHNVAFYARDRCMVRLLRDLNVPFDNKDLYGYSILHHAILQHLDLGVFQALLGCVSNEILLAQDASGNNILHLTFRIQPHPTYGYLDAILGYINVEHLKQLLLQQNAAGVYPIHKVCALATSQPLDRLLQVCNAELTSSILSLRDMHGMTPLCWANTSSIARMLISNGADINATDNNGSNVMMVACREGKDALITILLDDSMTRFLTTDNDLNTVLHHLAAQRLFDIFMTVHQTIKEKPGYDAVFYFKANVDGLNIIHIACMTKQHMLLGYILANQPCGSDLQSHVNAKCAGGYTPLMLAINKGYLPCVRRILSTGATVDRAVWDVFNGACNRNPPAIRLADQGLLQALLLRYQDRTKSKLAARAGAGTGTGAAGTTQHMRAPGQPSGSDRHANDHRATTAAQMQQPLVTQGGGQPQLQQAAVIDLTGDSD